VKNYFNFTKESSGVHPQISRRDTWSHRLLRETSGSVPGGIRPSRPSAPPAEAGGVELEYTASSGRKTGSILAPPSKQIRKADQSDGGVEPGHTPRPRDRPRGAHAVEFSKTVAPLQEGDSFLVGHPRAIRLPERTGKYSAESVPLKTGHESASYRPTQHSRTRLRTLYASTWTVTTRLRGRSSKSIRTICCQVPSASSPPTTGIVSEGPMIAARMWAWELVS
jgi:hypothetical protein